MDDSENPILDTKVPSLSICVGYGNHISIQFSGRSKIDFLLMPHTIETAKETIHSEIVF